MSADVQQIMRVLEHRGIDVRLVDGRLVGRHRAGNMPGDMERFIRHFKEQIVQELKERALIEETAANIAALTPQELAQYRAELCAMSPNSFYVEHDRRALRLALSWIAQREEAAS